MKKLILGILAIISTSLFAEDIKFDPQERKDYVFLDLRSLEEASVDHLDTPRLIPSIILPYDEDFADKASVLADYKDKTILIFCRTGRRSALGKEILQTLEFKDIQNLKTLAQAKEFETEIRNHLYPTSNEILLETISEYSKKLNIDINTPLKERNFSKILSILTPVIAENLSTDKQTKELIGLISELSYYIEKNYISSFYTNTTHPFTRADATYESSPAKIPSKAERERTYELFEQFFPDFKQNQEAITFIDTSRIKLAQLLRSHREKMLK